MKCVFAAHWCVLLQQQRCTAPIKRQDDLEAQYFPSCGSFYCFAFVYSWDLLAIICIYHPTRHRERFWRTLWSSDLQKTIVLASVFPRGLQRPASWLAGLFQPLLSSVPHYFRKHRQMRPTNYICEFNMQISHILPRQGPPGTCPAVFLQFRPNHGSNLARVPVRDTFVLMTNRQTTHAYRKGRKECLWWDWCRFAWLQMRIGEVINEDVQWL